MSSVIVNNLRSLHIKLDALCTGIRRRMPAGTEKISAYNNAPSTYSLYTACIHILYTPSLVFYAVHREYLDIRDHPNWPLYADVFNNQHPQWLASRRPICIFFFSISFFSSFFRGSLLTRRKAPGGIGSPSMVAGTFNTLMLLVGSFDI